MPTLAIGILLLGLLGLVLYKTWKVHLACFRIEAALQRIESDTSQTYRELQAYLSLSQLIQTHKPLPLLRGWAASPDFLLYLARYALGEHPRTIMECSSGASTVVLARCCELNGAGHVYSLEHDPEYAEKSRRLIAEQGLESWSTVIDAPLIEHPGMADTPWYSLDALPAPMPPIDLLVIDGPPGMNTPLARYPALPLLHKYLSASATVFLDDAARPDEREIVKRWQAMFSDFRLENREAEKGCAVLLRNQA